MFQDVTVYQYRRSGNCDRFPIEAPPSGNSAWTTELPDDYDKAAIEPAETVGACGFGSPAAFRTSRPVGRNLPGTSHRTADYAHVDDDVS